MKVSEKLVAYLKTRITVDASTVSASVSEYLAAHPVSAAWSSITGKPSFAPSNAQKNSDITKEEIETKLTGEISTHSHASSGGLTQAQILRMI